MTDSPLSGSWERGWILHFHPQPPPRELTSWQRREEMVNHVSCDLHRRAVCKTGVCGLPVEGRRGPSPHFQVSLTGQVSLEKSSAT